MMNLFWTPSPRTLSAYSLCGLAIAMLMIADQSAEVCAALDTPLPIIDRVDAQPLLLLTQRLTKALDTIGMPSPVETKTALQDLKREPDDSMVTVTVQ